MAAATWRTVCRWSTGYSADSVEWCPLEPHQNVLVCGTYQLDKTNQDNADKKQKRLGKICLFIIGDETTEVSPIQTIDTSGILDQKWCYHHVQNHPTLATVTSDGFLQLYRLVDEESTLSLQFWTETSIGQNILALSLDWSTNKIPSDEPSLVVSDSGGNVKVLKVIGDDLKEVGSWKAHGFEAWVAAFNYWNTDVFYSGGDDCLFKGYDIRMANPVVINKSHGAGVTAIRSDMEVEHRLLTGSYDEKVRLWDARNLKCCITEADVNGGVWRLKWHPHDKSTVLVACMYGGFRVVRIDEQISIRCEYLEHESIAYGADWKFNRFNMVATCSFYDCQMHIGQVIF